MAGHLISALVGLAAGIWLTGRDAQPVANDGLIIIPASGPWKTCHVDASANGHEFNMLLDTGATGTLTFGRNHAKALGFDPRRLSYTHTYSSANGEGKYALVTLREFRFQSFVMRDVNVAITHAPQNTVLLGLGILHRLNFRLNNGHCLLSLPDR